MMFIENYPDEIEFLSHFGIDPVVVDKRDINFGYVFHDNNGVELSFYFSVTGGWVDIEIKKESSDIVSYSTENVFEILIDDDRRKNEKIIVLNIISEESLLNSRIVVSPYIKLNITSLVG